MPNTLRFLSNRLQISLVCFGVNEAREATGGDVQLARRFEQFILNRWAANEQFETLVASILRNTPLRRPTVLTPKSLRRMLQISEGITANIFQMINTLAVKAVETVGNRFPMKLSRTGSPTSTQKPRSHDAETVIASIASATAALHRRTLVVVDLSARLLLHCLAARHASALSTRTYLSTRSKPRPLRRSDEATCGHAFRRTPRRAQHDFREGPWNFTSIDRRQAIAVLPSLLSGSLGLRSRPTEPAARVAHHLSVVRRSPQRQGWPRSRFSVLSVS